MVDPLPANKGSAPERLRAVVIAVIALAIWTVYWEPLREGALSLRIRGDLAQQAERGGRISREQEIDQRFRQGAAMLHIGHYEHAVTAFRRVIELAPRIPEAHMNLGFALTELGDHQAALGSFDLAIAIDKGLAGARYGRAVALYRIGRTEEATTAMQGYLDVLPSGDPGRRRAQAALDRWQGHIGSSVTGAR